MTQNFLIIISLLLHCLKVSSEAGIKVTSVDIPPQVRKGDEVTMKCCFDLANHKMYSVKWYRDDKEFFRYIPSENPSKVVFQIPGINVNKENSTGESVVLRNIDLNSGGRYKCEVVTDWPGFHTADRSAEMMVFVVPKEKPTIEGTQNEYRIGDTARLTCVSAPSLPAAELTWFINDQVAPSEYQVPVDSIKYQNGLEETRLSLVFDVLRSHFRNGEMTLRCSASISSIYYKTQQHSVDGQLTYSVPVMESRDIAAFSGSANIVQGQAMVLVMAVMVMITLMGQIQS